MAAEPAAATGSGAHLAGTGFAVPAPGTFLDLLTAGERQELMAVGRERAFPPGTALMYQDEPSDRIMILLDGRVKVTRIEGDGRESLLSIRDPGDLLGELSFIDGQPRVATVTTLEQVRALVTTPGELRHHLETTPRIAVALLEIVVRRFRESTLKRTQFANSDTMGRLAARIVELAERYGEVGDDTIAVEMPAVARGPGRMDGRVPRGCCGGAASTSRAGLDRCRPQAAARARSRRAPLARRLTRAENIVWRKRPLPVPLGRPPAAEQFRWTSADRQRQVPAR